jgi:hypothetical protein
VPDTTIDAGPEGTTQETTARFEFSADEGGASFECRLDGGAWEGCTSPRDVGGLGDGTHVFAVRAQDAEGHVDATPATRSWVVDGHAPTVGFDRAPASPTNAESQSFEFSADETATFECSLDGAAFSACSSPHELSGLGEGSHQLAVRATDSTGNKGAPATTQFAVDRTPPDTRIDSGPAAETDETSATFAFSAVGSEPGASFACTLDGAAASCTSPQSYQGLDDGDHTFTVAATDEAGNADPSPATRTWTIAGSDPPETEITAGPAGTILSRDVTFEFASSGPGASFECSLDGAPFEDCESPKGYTGLSIGHHTFQVVAGDRNGTDPTPASRTFEIDDGGTREGGTAPKLTPRKGKVAFAGKPVTIASIACFDGPCTLESASAVLAVKRAKINLKVKAPATLAPGTMANATVKIGGKAKKALLKRGKGKLTATIRVAAQGAPTATATASLKLKAPKKKKG